MRIVLIGNYSESILSFRGHLLSKFMEAGHEVVACAPGENPVLAAKLREMGVAYRSIALERTGINPLRDFLSFLELALFIRSYKPHIVFNYTIKPIIYGSFAAKLMGVPKIFSMVTGLGYVFIGTAKKHFFLKSLVTKLYKLALLYNKTIFFLNPDDLSLFCELNIVQNSQRILLINGEGVDIDYFNNPNAGSAATPTSKTIVINGSGVDLVHFTNVSVHPGPIVFLLIARLIKDKGIIEYVNAARQIKKRYPQAIFRLVGPFDCNPAAIQQSQVASWTEEGVVEYLGETKDVRPFIADASVYVLPSYREGLPRTILEAMAMGRPVITTDAPGCRETVTDNDNGFVVPVKDTIQLELAMERFILEPELIEKMGNRCRELVEKKYDVHKVNSVILAAMGL